MFEWTQRDERVKLGLLMGSEWSTDGCCGDTEGDTTEGGRCGGRWFLVGTAERRWERHRSAMTLLIWIT